MSQRLCSDVIVMAEGRVLDARHRRGGAPGRARDRGLFRRRQVRGAGMSALLSIRGLTAGYGGVPVIDGIDLDVAPQTVAVIIGPNGAGKSTLLKSVFALTQHRGRNDHLRRSRHHRSCDRRARADRHCRRAADRAMSSRPSPLPKISMSAPMPSPPRDRRAVEERVLTLFPDLRAKLGQPAGRLVGRPAPDGGDGPRADERAQTAPPR